LDNISGLSSHDMFNTQIAYFKKTLESALNNDYNKVTFIHGVGNGILKSAIVDELKEYVDVESKMASISKFGVGAIDVVIKSLEKSGT
jgi:dsDNA-specific endonuclease/ATPase MutS2